MIPNISSHGDQGDIISLLPIARALGKASVLVSDNPMCKPITKGPRFESIKPLVESQPYIERFAVHYEEPIEYDAATFRNGGIDFGWNLAALHAKWVGVKISEDPWLKIEPNKSYEGCVAFNRSTRHHNQLMNWKPILEHYLDDLVFIGLTEEWVQIQNSTGLKFRHAPTKNLLECAEIISASRVFLGNQSSNLNLAIGLGKKYLCETSLSSLDCVYKRDAFYCLDGSVHNFEVEGYDLLNVKTQVPQIEIDWNSSPPGQRWKMIDRSGVEHSDFSPRKVIRAANANEEAQNLPLSTLQDLANQMTERLPNWNSNNYVNCLIRSIETARKIIWDKQNSR